MTSYIVGLDLGSVNDYTALAVIKRYGTYTDAGRWQFEAYQLLHLERYLGEPYGKIISRVQDLAARPELRRARIVADATGVGRPVIDLLVDEGLRRLTSVTITGGDHVTSEFVRGRREFRVPKRDLVGCLQVLLQNRLLKIPANLELRDALVTELQNFKVKLSAETGHASYEHWRDSDHDDLVLAVALACWLAEVQPAAFDPMLL